MRFHGRWIIFLGWLLVLGAFTGAYSQKNINHKFPRVGTLQWGGGSPDWLKRFDLVITINPDSQRVRAARAMNPNAYYLATWDWNAGGPFYDIWDPSKIDTAWRLRDQSGVYIPYFLQSLVDITDYCGLVNGKKYNQALPERLNQEINWSVFDGVNSDGTWGYPGGTGSMGIDLDRNKRNDYTEPGKGYTWIRQVWHDGQNKARRTLRSLWGTDQKLITYWTVTDTMCMTIANGSGWENMFFNPPYSFRDWQPIISQWDSVHASMPRINWVCSNLLWDSANAPIPHALHVKEQWRFMRWTLGMALWGGAYFMIQENEHNNSLWYDECSADLGHPTGPPHQLPNGCFVRFFDKGVSILNATSGTQSVGASDLAIIAGYQGPYYRFRGNQDPLCNDGSPFTSVTLVATAAANGGDPVGDGIILFTTPQTIVSDIIVDDAPDGTSPGSQPAEMSGFAWDQQASSQDNPNWTTGPSWDNDPAHHRSHIAPPGSGSATAVYRPAINVPGKYTVYEWHGWAGATPSSLAEASNVPCRIVHANGETDLTINQRINYGQWNPLGTYHFRAGGGASVTVSDNANGYVVADAFRFVYAGGDSTFDLNGQIFFDRDGDGRKEPGEPGLPGWVVRLEGPLSASAVTDSEGHFEFDYNPPGTYALREDRQPFWQETLPSPPDTAYQFTAGGDSSVIERNFGNDATGAVELPVRASWNAVSVPLMTGDRRRTSLFPTATSDAFAYFGLYVPEDTMNYGTGYWLKFSGNENLWLAGAAFGRDTIAADTGWNFFGSISSPVAASSITTVPPGILRSAIWTYHGSYHLTDSIRPGTASWVKVYPSGSLILKDSAGSTAAAKTERDRLTGLNILLFTDAAGNNSRLYFSGRGVDRDLVSWFEIPPLPPGGTFDVRFLEPAGNSLVAALGGREPEVPIAVHSVAYPVRVTWNLPQDSVRYEMKADGGSFSTLGREGTLSLEAPVGGSGVSTLTLRLPTGGNGAGSIPASFEMMQNFPNPFNDQTVFTLSLPSDGHLKFAIFNVLGERVQTLIDNPMEAGSHTVPFSASDLTSGVYIYMVDFTPSAGQPVRKYGRMLHIR